MPGKRFPVIRRKGMHATLHRPQQAYAARLTLSAVLRGTEVIRVKPGLRST